MLHKIRIIISRTSKHNCFSILIKIVKNIKIVMNLLNIILYFYYVNLKIASFSLITA